MKTIDKNLTFKIIFIIGMFINTLAIGYLGIDKNYLAFPIILWGIILVIFGIVQKTIALKSNWMIVYGLILLLATMLNSYTNQTSYTMVAIQLLIFIIIFHPSRKLIKEEMKR